MAISRRFIVMVYLVVFTGFGAGAGAFYFDWRAEYRQLKRNEAEIRQRLAETEARLRQQDLVLERLKTDPEFVAKIIRQRLHYTKPDDVIFYFEH